MKTADKKMIDKCISDIEEIGSSIETLRDRLQEEFDDKSEKWQESDKGEELSQVISDLSAVIEEHLDDAKAGLESVKEAE
jgi:hypothetical protein